MISLYVLLTTRLPVPWGLLARAAGVLLGYMAAVALAPELALNIAVAVGLGATLWVRLPQAWFNDETRDAETGAYMLAIVLVLISISLFAPTDVMQFAISVGLFALACVYASVWVLDPDMLDKLGWDAKIWGVEGRANAVRWQVIRCAGLGVANAYTSLNFAPHDWVVAHALLPLVAYLLYHWTVIATHPYEDA